MEQQDTWQKNNQFIKNSIYRSDIDHPNSQHNITTGQSASMQVNIPKTVGPDGKVTLNGYYNKETMSLKNGFKEHTVKGIAPMDPRFSNENFNFQNKNKLYQPNIQLLDEIGKTQQMRQLQRDQRERMAQQVEEISPTGQRRTVVNSASRGEMTSEKRAMNPFADQQQNGQSQKDMFNMPPQDQSEMDTYHQQMDEMG